MQCSAKPYSGEEKYVFISYCHQDKAIVYPIIEQFAKDGCRLWYDEGITAGASWPEMIAKHLDGCHVCICAVTKAFSKSHNCRNEMTFALENNIPVIALILEDFTLPLGLRLQMSNTQQIRLSECGYENIFGKLYSGIGVSDCFGEKKDIEVHTPEFFAEKPKENVVSKGVSSLLTRMKEDRQLALNAKNNDSEEISKAAEAQRKAEEAAREAEARRKAEEAAREAEARRKAEEAAREAEARRKAEEAAREAEARRKAEEAAREAEVRRKAEEAAREAEARRRAEEAAKEAEARRKAEEAAREAEQHRRLKESHYLEDDDVTQTEAPKNPTKSSDIYFDDTTISSDEEALTVLETGDDEDATADEGHTVLEKKATAPVLVHLDTGRLYECKYPMTSVGRSKKKCDVVLDGFETISTHHLDLIIYKKCNYVIDRGSSNGTLIGDNELAKDERVEINSFTELKIASEEFFVAFDNYAEILREKMCLCMLVPMQINVKKFLFGEEVTLGRNHRWENSLFRSGKISREHAVLKPCDGGYTIKDISSNGTFINNRKIEKNVPITLADGDEIKMGSEIYTYRCLILEK